MPHPTVRLSALYGNATVLSLTAVRWRGRPKTPSQVQQPSASSGCRTPDLSHVKRALYR